jgi:hypothetical protein
MTPSRQIFTHFGQNLVRKEKNDLFTVDFTVHWPKSRN